MSFRKDTLGAGRRVSQLYKRFSSVKESLMVICVIQSFQIFVGGYLEQKMKCFGFCKFMENMVHFQLILETRSFRPIFLQVWKLRPIGGKGLVKVPQ